MILVICSQLPHLNSCPLRVVLLSGSCAAFPMKGRRCFVFQRDHWHLQLPF